MSSLTYHTAGESHGPALTTLINGLPAGLELDVDFINAELARRQGGYGRGARQKIEQDKATFLSGVRRVGSVTRTIGSPLVIQILNKDNRLDDPAKTPPVYRPRPGHADLAGSIKWLTTDCRETLERASARETAARTAAGAVARCLLREFEIESFSFVRGMLDAVTNIAIEEDRLDALIRARDESEVYCPDPKVSERIIAHIRQAKIDKDTVGGLAEVHVFGCPPGMGSCANWDQRLDARLAGAVMGIQAFKAVEIGLGKDSAFRTGSQVHDPILYDDTRAGEPNLGFVRPTNNAGGLEGGMTNGMPIVVRGTMKPISTLLRGMPSVDLNTKKPQHSAYERSDVCALPAASVVMENVVAFEVARAFLEKFAGDSMHQVQANYEGFMNMARRLPLEPIAEPREQAENQSEA
ncbi:MAG: chorismate synthase [Phycisphaerales bacterium]|nr:chorismate synthase [Phycisphaerales bacterium]MCI0629819.1 chorismate synthase [Phycisphaerales bacterium]MCI0674700.1 chorismate synthase [Phycisphaerales bacterium]